MVKKCCELKSCDFNDKNGYCEITKIGRKLHCPLIEG